MSKEHKGCLTKRFFYHMIRRVADAHHMLWRRTSEHLVGDKSQERHVYLDQGKIRVYNTCKLSQLYTAAFDGYTVSRYYPESSKVDLGIVFNRVQTWKEYEFIQVIFPLAVNTLSIILRNSFYSIFSYVQSRHRVLHGAILQSLS